MPTLTEQMMTYTTRSWYWSWPPEWGGTRVR